MYMVRNNLRKMVENIKDHGQVRNNLRKMGENVKDHGQGIGLGHDLVTVGKLRSS